MSDRQLLKIEFYVPEQQLQRVKQSMFDAGAGKVGNYDCCAWQILGKGQYRPGEGSSPFKGEQDNLETLNEYKVEMVCAEEFIAQVVRAMKDSHPYEEVAYSVIRTEVFN
ncbi:MAG: NGG1p interacting factor NIF3 [Gammaproteobacteria bacterium]|nr:NGG1p interacting factor NIF3 [Gammaproteobacteria bacterium]